MKRLYIILGMLLCCLTVAARDNWTIDPDSLPKGAYLDGKSMRVNLTEFLSVPEQKKAFLNELNAEYKRRGMVLNVMDFYNTDLQLPDSVKALRARANGQRRANAVMGSNYCQKVNFDYKSVDYMNQPVTLSGVMYIPDWVQENFFFDDYAGDCKSWWGYTLAIIPSIIAQIAKLLVTAEIDFILNLSSDQVKWGILSVHPTVTSNDEAPTGNNAPEVAAATAMPTERCLVVCPDYCGYGLTRDRQHPYLIQDITARNCIDGYLAALKIAKGKVSSWSSDFYTHIVGYSQGGSVALACAKYMQSGQLTEEEKKTINLQATFCGDGPYCPVATIDKYMQWANDKEEKYNRLAYPCVLPLICAAAKQYYDKSCMRTVKVEDYFTKEFLATGIISDLESKEVTTDQLNAKTKAARIYNIDQMMSDKMVYRDTLRHDSLFFNTKSNEYKCLLRALDKADLTKGWVPEKPIYFLHYDGDLVVPYANVIPVKERIEKDWKDKAFFIDAKDALKYLPQSWYFAARLKSVINTDEWDHVKVGVFFYIWYMSGCPYNYDHDGYWREVRW